MNKQELIERIEGLKNLFGSKSKYIEIDAVIKLASELDEPQKVQVPQFVADWIEKIKKELSLREAMSQEYVPHEVGSWLREMDQDGACLNQELFARAWLDGYEVKKEKRYLVEMKNLETGFNFLNYCKEEDRWIFSSKDETTTYRSLHTRKELEESGFREVFDSPLFEVEEVE